MFNLNIASMYELCVYLENGFKERRLFELFKKYGKIIPYCNKNNTKNYNGKQHLKIIFILSDFLCNNRWYTKSFILLTESLKNCNFIHAKNEIIFRILKHYIAGNKLNNFKKTYLLLEENESTHFLQEKKFCNLCYSIKTNNYKNFPNHKDIYNFVMEYINNNNSKPIFRLERFALNWTNNMLLEYTKKEVAHYNVKAYDGISINHQFNKNIRVMFISRDFWDRPTGQLLLKFFSYIKNMKSILKFYLVQIGFYKSDSIFKNLSNMTNLKCIQFQFDIISEIKRIKPDIIIDLQGLMNNNIVEILSLKLSPIQIAWLSYPSTLGMKQIDYMVSDKNVVFKKQKKDFMEKMLYMPDCYQINNDRINYNQFKSFKFNNSEVILPKQKDCILIGFLNSNYKIDIDSLTMWAKAFSKCKNAKLVLLKCSDIACCNIINTWVNDLNMPKEQLIYWPRLPKNRYLERTKRYLDFCIDSLYCNSHTTGSDILSTGTPLLTLSHPTFAGQVAASLLKTIKCYQLIANNKDDYINKIIKMANDTAYRYRLIQKVKYGIKKYNLFNSYRYFNHFILGLEKVYENYRSNIKEDIYIQPLEEYKFIKVTYNKNIDLNLSIQCQASTCKIIIENILEILINEPCHEIWLNKNLIGDELIQKFPKFPDGSSNNLYKLSFITNKDKTNIILNKIQISTINLIEFNQIKCNGIIIDSVKSEIKN